MFNKQTLVALFFLAGFAVLPMAASALVATPAVVDIKAHARDIEKQSLTLKNDSAAMVEVYPFVFGISSDTGAQTFLDPSQADESSSLANWIEITRSSLMLSPGQTLDVPFTVNVNLRAVPAVYHVVVVFARGSNRDEAAKNVGSAVRSMINVEVLSDAKERLQLTAFSSTKSLWLRSPITFEYHINNVGNRSEVPTGDIRIYDSHGVELGTIALNDKNESIAPDASVSWTASWDGIQSSGIAAHLGIKGFGKYKAVLEVQYGPDGAQTLQDTAVFWVVPLVPALIFIAFMIALLLYVRPRVHRE